MLGYSTAPSDVAAAPATPGSQSVTPASRESPGVRTSPAWGSGVPRAVTELDRELLLMHNEEMSKALRLHNIPSRGPVRDEQEPPRGGGEYYTA